MTCINFCNSANVVSFSEIALNKQAVNVIIQEGKDEGLSNTDELHGNLQESNYIPVLKSVWSERDRARRLEWLREVSSQLHAPLMYELAISEFTQNPTIATIAEVSMPLIKAGSFRTKQDAVCCSDPCVLNGDHYIRFEMAYTKRLNTQIQKHLKKSLADVIFEQKAVTEEAIKEKVKEIAVQSLNQELPNPSWIKNHGLFAEMYPDSEFAEKRSTFANNQITAIESKDN